MGCIWRALSIIYDGASLWRTRLLPFTFSSIISFLVQLNAESWKVFQINRNNGAKLVKYYWFFFSFVASKHSHIYLHTQIRLIFPQQTPDGKLQTITEGPTDPKYTPISNYNRFDLVESSSYIEIWHV